MEPRLNEEPQLNEYLGILTEQNAYLLEQTYLLQGSVNVQLS